MAMPSEMLESRKIGAVLDGSDLTKLRLARSRCHFALHQLEMQVEAYAFKPSQIGARIQAIAPELELPPRHRRPKPHFARGELPRLALAILREAGEPPADRCDCRAGASGQQGCLG
jgi:hypothetical protein